MRTTAVLLLAVLSVAAVQSVATGQDEVQADSTSSSCLCSSCASDCCCDSCCSDTCGCGFYCGCCDKDRLFGLLAPSDCRFTDFISPMTNPVFFEDPRNLTEARVIFLNN